MAALLGAHIIKVKLPNDYLENAEAKKVYLERQIPTATLPERVRHVMQSCFNGRRIVVFSGGAAKGEDAVYEDARAIREGGGNGSIIGRNSFQRSREDALGAARPSGQDLPREGITPEFPAPRTNRGAGNHCRSFPDMADCRLYICTPPALDPAEFAPKLEQALDAGDVACLQLRLKDVDDDTVRRAIDSSPIAQSARRRLHPERPPRPGRRTGCDGVHVGQSDMALRQGAQIAVGPDADRRRDLPRQPPSGDGSRRSRADYVAFGAFSRRRPSPPTTEPEPELLEWWSEMMEVPCVAIGGITARSCAPLVKAGADFILVVTAVWNHPKAPAPE